MTHIWSSNEVTAYRVTSSNVTDSYCGKTYLIDTVHRSSTGPVLSVYVGTTSGVEAFLWLIMEAKVGRHSGRRSLQGLSSSYIIVYFMWVLHCVVIIAAGDFLSIVDSNYLSGHGTRYIIICPEYRTRNLQ